MEKLTVRNPVALLPDIKTPLAPRPLSLHGLTLGLWWNLKEGGDVAVEYIGEVLQKRYGMKLHKEYSAYPGPKHMIESMAKTANVVLGSTGD